MYETTKVNGLFTRSCWVFCLLNFRLEILRFSVRSESYLCWVNFREFRVLRRLSGSVCRSVDDFVFRCISFARFRDCRDFSHEITFDSFYFFSLRNIIAANGLSTAKSFLSLI